MLSRKGWIPTIYIQTTDTTYGPPGNLLNSEVVFGIQKDKDNSETFKETFGIKLSPGDIDMPANLAMLAALKDALFNNLPVTVVSEDRPISGTKTMYMVKKVAIARREKDLPG